MSAEKEMYFFNKQKTDNSATMPKAHVHNSHELYWLIKGNVKYFIGNEIFILSAGDMIFVPKGIFHKTDYEECNEIERIVLSFTDDFIGEEFSEYTKEFAKNKHIRFTNEFFYKIQDIMNKLEKEEKKRENGFEKLRKIYLQQLLIFISRYRINEIDIKINSSYLLIQNIAKYISENYNADLSLNSLAKKYCISPNHLSKQFKKTTGVGLNEYINISRIVAAEHFLKNTNHSITKVATECGFNDSNYFAAVFKKIKGITPKKYSMQNKNFRF